MTVRFYLKRPNDSRKSVIFARFNHNMLYYKYYLLVKVHPADWNFKTQRVKKKTRKLCALEFNHKLEDITIEIINSFIEIRTRIMGNYLLRNLIATY